MLLIAVNVLWAAAFFGMTRKLQAHRETRETAVFALEAVKDRFTLEPVPADRDVTNTAAFSAGASASSRGVGVDLGAWLVLHLRRQPVPGAQADDGHAGADAHELDRPPGR